jgi:hypothetical protein
MKYTLAVIILIFMLMFVRPAAIHAADYLDPPSGINVPSARAFRNLVEDGDMAIVFHYEIDYGVDIPEVLASASWIFRLYSEDGNTLLSTSTPYVFSSFNTNGYGNGVGSFYFTHTGNPGWKGLYRINLFGVPLYYNPIESFTYSMTSADYVSATTQESNRNEMFLYVLSLCDTFHGIYPTLNLASSTDVGRVLSDYGDVYFRGAVPGIQAMCPQLFFVQVYIPETMTTEEYNLSLQETYTQRLVGTDLMRGAERIGDLLGGMSGIFVFGIFTFIVCIGSCIVTMRKGWGIEPGMLASAGLTILAALLLGDIMFTLVMVGALIAGMAIMFILFFKRA